MLLEMILFRAAMTKKSGATLRPVAAADIGAKASK